MILLMCAMLELWTPSMADATEGGGSARVLGIDTTYAGVMLPPGWHATATYTNYMADSLRDGSGNPRQGISNFSFTGNFVSVRGTYVWEGAKLWGADIETRVGANVFADVNLSFDVQTPAGKVHREGSESGFGGAFFAPALLGWHSAQFHQIAGLVIFAPLGGFDPNAVVNLQVGAPAVAPAYWFTWLPRKDVEASGALFYIINGVNTETGIRSGNEVGFDFGASYSFNPAWGVGLSGFVYKQVTDDTQYGSTFRDGNRGQAVGIGPTLRYRGTDWGVVLKWQAETLVENKSKGNRTFLQLYFKL